MKRYLFSRKKIILGGVFFSILTLYLLNVIAAWTYKSGIGDLAKEGNIGLNLYISYLEGVLEKYESLPELLAIDKNLVSALLSPHERRRIEKLNRYLETINKVSDALDTYLMNKDGLTIAASNWQEKHPFIGRNFSYRPYFKQAMKGKLGRYFALGSTSSLRGYYFAYPVRKDEQILGAVVVKINIDSVEQKWAHRDNSFLVTDPDGVVFITTKPEWRYKTLKPLADDVISRIVESKRYPVNSLMQLGRLTPGSNEDAPIIEMIMDGSKHPVRMLTQSQTMPQAGWTVHILSDTAPLRNHVFLITCLSAFGLLLGYILALMLGQRHYRLADLNRMEEKVRKGLESANEQLESRVLDRTEKLTKTNRLLRKEIVERELAETKLKKTRNELIHAAKLAALGQMSAGINHELNQPLAAIRSYTDNGKQFLEKGRLEDTMWNLEQIGELTERMAQIGVQLKLFSRKSSGQIAAVPLHGVIDGALEILRPGLRKSGVQIFINIHPEEVEVRANNLLLQQVMVNLISNSMQAVEQQSLKQIAIEAYVEDEIVHLSVEDTGTGVQEEDRGRIFDPFYTTKKSGYGLGLGLSISDSIIQDIGGQIKLAKSSTGARFEILIGKA
ncbi:MAG: sensor histidine kinase [Deltaproteobacteria bacterium]|nr:sensor histidine kinase [Deltaproteobacteria bacterium]